MISTGLTGKTISQDFDFTLYTWSVPILVETSAADPEYGSMPDLRSAYAEEYVSFTDVFGDTRDVYTLGELPEPYGWALVDETVHFKINLSLRKVET